MPERMALGIDIGGTYTKIALVAMDGSMRGQISLPTRAQGDPRRFLNRLLDKVEEFLSRVAPCGIGIALPGFLDSARRSIEYNPNTPGLVGVDFAALFEPFDLPVHIEQDLNVPAVAEYYLGAGKGTRRLMTASIGTGLGAAVMIEGQILRFSGGTAGDNGHVILDPGGPSCTGGCRGCAEAMIATPAIERLALEKIQGLRTSSLRAGWLSGSLSAKAVIAAAAAGDELSQEIMSEIGSWLGQWLASIAPIFLPEKVALCGGVAEAGEVLRLSCLKRFLELAGLEYTQCEIYLSGFKGQAGVIGAALPLLVE